MADSPSAAPVARPVAAPDPVAEVQALTAMAVGLGSRLRATQRQALLTQRKAALQLNALARVAARLLQSVVGHGVPVLPAGNPRSGWQITHFILRSDRQAGPPATSRLLAVGSDGRLRCCVISSATGARVWADYDAAHAPADLPVLVVLDALTRVMGRLEQAVAEMELRQLAEAAELEIKVPAARARLSTLTRRTRGQADGTREPRPPAPVATASGPPAPVAPAPVATAPVASADAAAARALPVEADDDAAVDAAVDADDDAAVDAAAGDAASAAAARAELEVFPEPSTREEQPEPRARPFSRISRLI